MDKQRCLQLLEAFKSVRVMAIGDIYLDEYVHGKITEISLEAPIPVFEVLAMQPVTRLPWAARSPW